MLEETEIFTLWCFLYLDICWMHLPSVVQYAPLSSVFPETCKLEVETWFVLSFMRVEEKNSSWVILFTFGRKNIASTCFSFRKVSSHWNSLSRCIISKSFPNGNIKILFLDLEVTLGDLLYNNLLSHLLTFLCMFSFMKIIFKNVYLTTYMYHYGRINRLNWWDISKL